MSDETPAVQPLAAGAACDKTRRGSGGSGGAGDGSEYEGSDYSGSGDDSDDEEPALRYKRLGGDVATLFEKDTASALIAAERFLVLGTHWGNVVIIDFEGNEVKRWRAHSATVNSVCVDAANEFVASAGDDGRVVVHGLYSDDVAIVSYSRPVKAVALDPHYGATRRFVSGGTAGELIMYEKKWLGKCDTILYTSGGPIQTIQWQDGLIAWACDEGVQIYSVESGSRISHIARPASSPRADLFCCRMHWTDPRTLLIGWANVIQVVTLKEHPSPDGSGPRPQLHAEVSVVFRTDSIVCGLALHRDSYLVFSYGDGSTAAADPDVAADAADPDAGGTISRQRRDAQPPELRTINHNIEEVSSDILPLESYALLQPNDYGLAPCAAQADTWFILSPKQLVAVRPRGLADHVQWLAERGLHQRALEDIEDAYAQRGPWAAYRDQVKQSEYQAIGQAHAQALMDAGDTREAAAVCARVLPRANTKDVAEAWEAWVFAFAEAGALQDIAGMIPTDQPRLSGTVYEMVLAFLLASDIARFTQMVHEWPASLFNTYSVVLAAEDQMARAEAQGADNARALKETIAMLYDRLNQPSKSLRLHLELQAPGILARVRRENLFDAVRDKAVLVLQYDDRTLGHSAEAPVALAARCGAEGVQLLTDNTDAIPPASVVRQLVAEPERLHVYLHALLAKDAHLGAPFADLQVELYAEFDAARLLGFLRASTYYSLERALEICEERALVPEMVFILGRMGDNHRALMLIIERLNDVPGAIEFAKEQNDPELWRDLVVYAHDKPEFIIGLLELGGTHTSPTAVIHSIPPNLRVPGIRRALTNVLHDYHLQVDLCTGCRRVLDGDCTVLADSLRRIMHRGLPVDGGQPCLACEQPLGSAPHCTLAFWCGHVFHDHCILLPDVQSKTQMPALERPGLPRRMHPALRSPRDQQRMLTQAKLDRTVHIRQYGPVCPVCAANDDDRRKALQAHSAWSPAERRDRGLPDPAPPAVPARTDLPPIQTLQI
ncbi:Vacuolar protein sorting-associated protein 41 [Coemansia biformis]|uniref:Vacuolar protein sorting-associated protein 41 n=1 Tax=Coemansia biformis TaxID=1286918 RepID=A0A9W8CWS3_9FUNG|nr:Vacuolar protein sorting-associated protein 41 [Coemansia biformis]